ncbi:MAG: hypothetical protein FD181_2162 [Prolixibacteraceae bacterium]|nr:MAG: hypothetical protein FD181_2162 [Prolixibacteraceae bacterium]
MKAWKFFRAFCFYAAILCILETLIFWDDEADSFFSFYWVI